MAVQIHCPYCKEVLYIKEEDFDIETTCSQCKRAFVWSNILEQERWKEENLKRWQESQKQEEEMRLLEEVKKSRELQTPESEYKTDGGKTLIRSRSGFFVTLGVIAALVIIAAIIALALHKKSRTAKREKEEQTKQEAQRDKEKWANPAFSLPAEDLYRAYKENEIRADSQYKGKVLAVAGNVTDIGRDIVGDAYVCLAGSDRGSGIQCFFSRSDEGTLEQLSKGDNIHVVGECKGMMLWNVILFNCRRW